MVRQHLTPRDVIITIMTHHASPFSSLSPFPRPITDRDIFIVQDYVLVDEGKWFYTYNHDIDHPYFAPREGYVRANVRYQGLLGEPNGSNTLRLTWLLNMDFGGLGSSLEVTRERACRNDLHSQRTLSHISAVRLCRGDLGELLRISAFDCHGRKGHDQAKASTETFRRCR